MRRQPDVPTVVTGAGIDDPVSWRRAGVGSSASPAPNRSSRSYRFYRFYRDDFDDSNVTLWDLSSLWSEGPQNAPERPQGRQSPQV